MVDVLLAPRLLVEPNNYFSPTFVADTIISCSSALQIVPHPDYGVGVQKYNFFWTSNSSNNFSLNNYTTIVPIRCSTSLAYSSLSSLLASNDHVGHNSESPTTCAVVVVVVVVEDGGTPAAVLPPIDRARSADVEL